MYALVFAVLIDGDVYLFDSSFDGKLAASVELQMVQLMRSHLVRTTKVNGSSQSKVCWWSKVGQVPAHNNYSILSVSAA